MERALLAGLLSLSSLLSGCALERDELTTACQFYFSIRAVADLVPSISNAASAIVSAVDPVCKAVLTGQRPPTGYDAFWVRGQAIALEALVRPVRTPK